MVVMQDASSAPKRKGSVKAIGKMAEGKEEEVSASGVTACYVMNIVIIHHWHEMKVA